MKRQTWLLVALATGSLLAAQEQSRPLVEWRYYGGDPGGMKYSMLDQINLRNVQRLQAAWQWKHWETPPAPGFFEGTPLMIDGVLYVTGFAEMLFPMPPHGWKYNQPDPTSNNRKIGMPSKSSVNGINAITQPISMPRFVNSISPETQSNLPLT